MSADAGQIPLEWLQQQLVACQRQAMLGSFAGMIVHEYNNLMTPVLARAEDALARGDVAAMRKALATTARQAQKALLLSRQVLRLAQGSEPSLQTCGVADLVGAAITSAVRPFEKDGITLELHIPDGLHVRAQPLLFEQVVLNLLLNARAAMKGQQGKLSVSARQEDNVVVIEVCDSGVGMSPTLLETVINPFLAADAGAPASDRGSVGLGLHVCRSIARKHGATLRAYANDGPGWPAA
jgi:signal transduction histidine kinase